MEFSLFGPGYGESIVIHLGNNDWMIVDSCLTPGGKPAALVYLESIGVNAATDVRVVVSSHWHDDHIRGISEVFRACSSAVFVTSAAMQDDEFLEVTRPRQIGMLMESSGVDELNAILDMIEERDRKGTVVNLKFVMADRPVWGRAGALPCEVTALSPSDDSFRIALRKLSSLIPQKTDAKVRIPSPEPNDLAIALWVKISDLDVILGSDLEETPQPRTGWSIIVDSTTRPQGKAFLFKVPHHGSQNGHQQRVWNEMLISEPLIALTPWHLAGRHLPKKEDVERLCAATTNGFATHKTRGPVKKRSPAVEKTIRETVRSISAVPMCRGQIRIRKHINGSTPHRVDLIGTALKLSQLL